MDVSRPLYGQLQKLTGTENSNVHVSATQSTQANKVSRFCMFFCYLFQILLIDMSAKQLYAGNIFLL